MSSPTRHARQSSFQVPEFTPTYSWHSISKSSSSPEDGDTFRRQIQIDMRGLVGDGVGSMSISPTNRDVVLAARKGLFIIDLNIHSKVPRFLPQGGTWDVADVQWNPHPSHVQYIVSTSSEKLLIWNLSKSGNAIEHALHQHYRAITDINWHTTEPDTVVSTGIDSWLWAWDLRDPRKAVFGLSAFNEGGTQVKWNRQDPNVLASSHGNSVLVWDRRKGSLPVTKIVAHTAKIYGIDWSHNHRTEIVTCSLDRTIKVWDVNALAADGIANMEDEPSTVINTTYPVWRARDLPFGRGVLSLPQRGETVLEMFAHSDAEEPIELFEGHEDVVKEFVWRRAGDEFQLVTWSRDRTLRTWPIDLDTMQRAGHNLNGGRNSMARPRQSSEVSFGFPPEPEPHPATISAPMSTRAMSVEIHSSFSSRFQPPPQVASGLKASLQPPQPTSALSINIQAARNARHGSTISRGNFAGKSLRTTTVDPFAWLSSVKVGAKRGREGSGDSSAERSRDRATSRRPESHTRSRMRDSDEEIVKTPKDEGGTALQDEITSVLTKLAASKIKLEKHDLAKKRTCTLGMQGPWGENNVSVFIRISFTFPREYPYGTHPKGTPSIDLERNPLIPIRTRAQMLRKLRSNLVTLRPCLEACLRFLLFRNENVQDTAAVAIQLESSSDEEDFDRQKKTGDGTVKLLRTIKNLAEPRTSQGVFGPNGEIVHRQSFMHTDSKAGQLICFFRAPHRVVRNGKHGSTVPTTRTRQLKTPSLVSEAVHRLSHVSLDGPRSTAESTASLEKVDMSDRLSRVMNNLLTFSEKRWVRTSEVQSRSEGDSGISPHSSEVNIWRTVFIHRPDHGAEVDEDAAALYRFDSKELVGMCKTNAQLAADIQRYDHERVFLFLSAILSSTQNAGSLGGVASKPGSQLETSLLNRLYMLYAERKDIQMLAVISIIIILRGRPESYTPVEQVESASKGDKDYFSHLPKQPGGSVTPLSPGPPWRSPYAMSTSSSSRGSWSSIFNRPAITVTRGDVSPSISNPPSTPGITSERTNPVPMRQRRFSRNSPIDPHMPATSKSWSEVAKLSISLPPVDFNLGRGFGSRDAIPEKRQLVFRPPDRIIQPRSERLPMESYTQHVLSYAEVLFGLQLLEQRAELLKAIGHSESSHQYQIGIGRTCRYCHGPLHEEHGSICDNCGVGMASTTLRCTVCRLAVRGLSFSCSKCLHVSHISCRNSIPTQTCPTGCGCICTI